MPLIDRAIKAANELRVWLTGQMCLARIVNNVKPGAENIQELQVGMLTSALEKIPFASSE